jgi:predicted DCC family thiol-disulfide oxidoreductase YuxK
MSVADPNARVVVFDGICNICSGWVRFLQRHRIEPPFKLIPMQSQEGKLLLADYGIDPEDPTTFLVLDQGRQFTQSDGAIHIIAALGGLWSLFEAVRVIPKTWRDFLYRLLARNRYRWF